MSDEHQSDEKLSRVEHYKLASRGLRGPIGVELGQHAPAFSEEAVQLLKHHGTYQQDDRDTRTERKKAGLDRDYRMMVRTKFPAGTITAEQYLLCDELADKYGQGDLRVTSRQCFQFHGVVKRNLRPLVHDLNRLAEITTIGACGDVVRNTVACPVADIDPAFADCGANLIEMARRISAHFIPRTTAYYDLWLDDAKATVHEDGTVTFADDEPSGQPEEPIYRKAYLPRKFKIGVTVDFDNSCDIYTQDAGLIGVTENGRIVGWDVTAGGGLGYTHRKPKTYARLGSHIAFVPTEDVIAFVEAIVKVQRDHGGRSDRKHARLKYLIDDWGLDRFREAVFEYAGGRYDPPRGVAPSAQPDYLGWSKQLQPGLNYVGVWIENGRIRDFDGGFQFRTGLREIIARFRPSVRLTPHHNIVLAGIPDAAVPDVQALLDQYRIPTSEGISPLRRLEMACPALPLCGLAMAEAERFMPRLISELEAAGHGDANVILRISGCPNNCSRPRTAEIGVIGCGADRYQLYTGGDYLGTRLNELITEKLTGDQLAPTIGALLTAWKAQREAGERFGDWSARVGVDAIRALTETESAATG